MENPLALQPFRVTPEVLQSPLPFDLYSGKGLLLVKQGTQVRGDAEILLGQPVYRARKDADNEDQLNLQRLETLYRRYGATVAAWNCRSQDVRAIKRCVDGLVHLCGKHSDLCVASASHLPGGSHAVRHCFAAAIVAILLGAALGWNLRRQHVAARAALTMNLAQLAMHDEWAKSRARLGVAQQAQVVGHPGLSAEWLLQSPGADCAWIAAVDQHHENLDGSGYPLGLGGHEIAAAARVLRVADAWCALILPRSGRARKTPKDAMQEMSGRVGEHFDPAVFQALKQLMGVYPPGTFVRLANRETAIVMRWDKQGSVPKYATSVLSPSGEVPREFKLRSLTRHGYEIRDYTYLDMAQMARFSVSRIWAAGAA